ncbi:MAG: exo-alpha-sialidase [Planctomycetes bacterium]|nr:exo-alpha-sialidase [Planctomycetota bacterium]
MRKTSAFVILAFCSACPLLADENREHSVEVLRLSSSLTESGDIDYAELPRVGGSHAVISAAALDSAAAGKPRIDLHNIRFQLHNYLAHHAGRLWCIWSDGPRVEDEPTQQVSYSTSLDGIRWSEPQTVTGKPEAPYAFIARGLWVRDGELLALAAHFKGKGAFGADKELELQAYVWHEQEKAWRFKQKLYDNAINNFAPQRLSGGDWIMTRRDSRFNVSVLIGGQKSLDDWQSFPVVGVRDVQGFRPDEPIFWPLADNTLFALYRDNGGSRRLFHSVSMDQGRNWGKPLITNFPNATSKVFSIRTRRDYRVLVLNANPKVGRRQLHLAVSKDDRHFTRMALLDIPSPPSIDDRASEVWHKFRTGVASLQYPHVIEYEEHLLIAFSRNKHQTEVLRVSLDDVDQLVER